MTPRMFVIKFCITASCLYIAKNLVLVTSYSMVSKTIKAAKDVDFVLRNIWLCDYKS